MEGCTFKPKVNEKKKFSKVQSTYAPDQAVLDNIKMAQKKKELETEQLRKYEILFSCGTSLNILKIWRIP